MTGGDWIHEAMCDDSLVAEALICLLHAEPSPPGMTSGGASDLKLKWTVRQRRTKAASLRKKGDHDTRASPTTPLSWSGATSFSGGAAAAADGFEESSRAVKLSEAVRSKISQTNVTTTTPFKRSRKKKTLAQLKEEESLLLKEKKGLKNELASMRDLLKQQRARNESLKKKMQAESQKNEDSSFLLPDLNIPLDNNNPSPESLYGSRADII
ncbi:hypothetical protein CARUB_v10010293mg [Capsella rubella]|uniref:Uncharacterized protein n=1 Tax=Capsella rubella TaxID=81985 RepID=R0IJI7_9BRAS|nr:uncharacterized protein LOC17897058 [Capsella rubella]EOA37103.1 hypothetical protein CARUB_v10010293mg [Capsella rubella]